MKKEKLRVLIPDGEGDNFALSVLRCLGQVPDIRVSVLSQERWPSLRFSRYQSDFFLHNVDSFDRQRLDVILQVARQVKADIILPVNQPAIRLISKYCDEVHPIAALPPLPKPELMDIVSDKWLLAEYLEKENIPHPSTILYQTDKFREQDLVSLTYPILVKPLDRDGGEGIMYFAESSELSNYLKNTDRPEKLILQSYVHGYDIDCSILCQNGEILAYTIQKALLPGKKRFEPAASIEFLYHEQVYDVVQRLMRILNWSGVAHIDLRYDERDKIPKIIEMNPRYWGSLIGSLVAGINFPYLACLASKKINYPKPEYQYVNFSRLAISLKDSNMRKFNYSGMPFLLRDPLPELHKHFTGMFQKVLQKLAR